ncbi:MAG: hypothetical protein BMS9Abin28_1956 [Anaerolineae bacterium]|nr:MAG: hypothetical protein BMS9Abin28_1956 [Anaerolineae bacterium]
MVLELEVAGTHYEMGMQHARQVRAQRPLIFRAMAARQSELEQLGFDYAARLQEAAAFMASNGDATWQMMRGITDGLGLDWAAMQRYAFSSYLLDSHHTTTSTLEGCTTFAASAPATKDGAPLLAKNRDYRRDHIAMQTITRAHPARGYRYLHLGSAGSPGVYSSGMNERGLAVADTYVPSLDLGPGLPRYALMLDLLEGCADVPAAIGCLRSVTHMGGGTLILADASGRLAICESSHRGSGYMTRDSGWLVSTNHFSMPELRDRCLEKEQPGNSQARRAYVEQALAAAVRQVDVGWIQALLSHHDDGLACICRHERSDSDSATILAAIFLPRSRQLVLGDGNPCLAKWISVMPTVSGWSSSTRRA